MVNNLEKAKAKIEFFKTLFLIFIAALFSSIGYFFSKLGELNQVKFFIIVYAIIILTGVTLLFLVLWLREIHKLKD